jgi:metallo-beta-lactamase family protein
MGSETESLNSEFGFDPKTINCLLLSHAHIDHSGLIPKLVNEGFEGKIYCTAATAELAEILLHDSAEIQTYESEYINKKRAAKNLPPYEPLYTHEDVVQSVKLFEIVEYNKPFYPEGNVEVVYTNNGHLLGSAAIHLSIIEDNVKSTILFSGDVGRFRSLLLQPPSQAPQADYVIIESTYGDKHHNMSFNNIDLMNEWIQKTCIEKGGKLIIPAFSVGRTQEILYILNQLELEQKLPDIHFFVDSPLSQKATEAVKNYPELYNDRLQEVLKVDDDPFLFKGLKYVETVEDSKALKDTDTPCVIISASGTADAGRVRHHISTSISDKKNTILMAGYCGVNSLGGQLLNRTKEVELFNDTLEVKAEVSAFTGLSAHADADDLLQFIGSQDVEKVKAVFLVHGEYNTQVAFKSRLENKGFKKIFIPEKKQEFELS